MQGIKKTPLLLLLFGSFLLSSLSVQAQILYTILQTVDTDGVYTPVSGNGSAGISTNDGATFVEIATFDIDERGVALFPTYLLEDVADDTPFRFRVDYSDLNGIPLPPYEFDGTVAEFLALATPLQLWPRLALLPLKLQTQVLLPSIAEIAISTPELTTLVAAVTAASNAGNIDFLGAISDPNADLTVFAPTDAAFAALGDALDPVVADPGGLLTDVLAYHVLGSSENAADLIAAGSATTLLGEDVTITVNDDGTVFINNAQVMIADVQAANGVVHVIDAVLLPPEDPDPLPTIAEIAVNTPELTTLVAAVTAASNAGNIDFLGAISDPNADLTVFAPTDAAFAALGDALDPVLADPGGLLTDILAYHVLGAASTGSELARIGTATTLLGEDVTITEDVNGDLFINDAKVVIGNVQAANGIVHVIDAVLLPPEDPDPLPTIAEIAVNTPELSTLVSAVTLASNAGNIDFLGAISDPTADLTVFAPTDAAFTALGDALDPIVQDPGGLLTDILAYHVLGSSEAAADLIAAGSATTLLGEDVAITVDDDGNVFINDAQVMIADVPAANGVVHVIDAVLVPPSDPAPLQTIAEIAVNTPTLSTLVSAVTLASNAGNIDFLGAISDPNADLTVFAPTDAAFAALGDALDPIVQDPGGLLTDILSYHVLGSSEAAADLIAAGRATTLLGEDVAITIDDDGNVFINDAQVMLADIQAANGIVHVIDAVLVPPSDPAPLQTIAEIAVNTPELSTLVSAVTLASNAGNIDFLGAISDPNADLTVFAPTDAAFAALGDALDAVVADPGGLLTDILAYHVLGSSEAAADLIAAGRATTLLGRDVAITVDDDGNVFINNAQVMIADVQAANGIVHVIDTVLLPPSDGGGNPIVDGAQITLESNLRGGFATPNAHGNVVLSHEVNASVWELEDAGGGAFYLRNVEFDLYLDADSARSHYNVDIGNRHNRGTEWEIILNDDGTYVLKNVDYRRVLDGDPNVDTSKFVREDDLWVIELAQ